MSRLAKGRDCDLGLKLLVIGNSCKSFTARFLALVPRVIDCRGFSAQVAASLTLQIDSNVSAAGALALSHCLHTFCFQRFCCPLRFLVVMTRFSMFNGTYRVAKRSNM